MAENFESPIILKCLNELICCLVMELLLSFLFYGWGSWGAQRLSNFLNVTEVRVGLESGLRKLKSETRLLVTEYMINLYKILFVSIYSQSDAWRDGPKM